MKKIGYWVLQLTWGIVMTIAGLFTTLFVLLFMRKKATFHKNGYSFIIEIGGNWGGVNLGAISLCGNYSKTNTYWYEHTRKHEFGHSIQNIIFGPFQLFLVAIPSVIRYWYKYFAQKKGKRFGSDWYDCYAWFEYTASLWGYKAINKIEGTNIKYMYEGKYKNK